MASSHLPMLLGLFVYGYARGHWTGASVGDLRFVAFRFIAANDHPDHGTSPRFGGGS